MQIILKMSKIFFLEDNDRHHAQHVDTIAASSSSNTFEQISAPSNLEAGKFFYETIEHS